MTAFLALALSAVGPTTTMPITGLAPAREVPNLCTYHYRVSTPSAECQTLCDQGLAYHASYVWMEAARSFETALTHDPECAMAWLGLHKALDKWGKTSIPKSNPLLAVVGGMGQPVLPSRYTKSPKDYALEMAKSLLPKASHREGLLITSKLQERGMWPNTPAADRKKNATATLDELLTLYDDDEEGWFARGQIADAPIPFYKALLRINPLHPAANHELVHLFERAKRPALGWPHAEKYMESSPGLPHAMHMQAHLAMRIGKWSHTTDWSSKAIELQKAYHAMYGVKPGDDHQFSHHLETLTRSMVHDGRFAEAAAIRKDAMGYKYHYRPEWIRMAILQADWKDAESLIDAMRKSDKSGAAYYSALVALAQGDLAKVKADLDVLKPSKPSRRGGKKREARQWEIEGRLLCATGEGDAGLKLLKQAVDKTKDDYEHHAWGNGASLMEAWGEAALDCGNLVVAEEAFQEALAHDSGSVKGALGLWALCEKQGRGEAADRYLKLAHKCWSRAESRDFERMKGGLARPRERLDAADQ